MLPKIDLIRAELELYDIAVFSESWLKPNITDDKIALLNFLPPFRTDRRDRLGGGVVIYARDTLSCKRRNDIEINGLEVVWIVKSKKVLVGGIYRPPNSNSDYFNLILESTDRAHKTYIPDIIITGDFNYNMLFCLLLGPPGFNCVSSKIYDKRDDFDSDKVNFPFLDGDVPRSTSCGVYISQLIRFARVSSHVIDFNARSKSLTAIYSCWFSFAPVFQWCCSTPQGSPGVGRNTFLSRPHLCFIIVFICDLFVSRDDPLMS